MAEKVGFVTMGEIGKTAAEIPEIGIGMLGYAFMGKAHSNALKTMPYIFWPPPMMPKLVGICGRNQDAVAEAAKRFGFEKFYTDWQAMIKDPEIQLFENLAPNSLHAEPCIAAAEAGKHVLCEKPLARTAQEAKKMWETAEKAGVKHACAYNYRFVPAIQQAKQLIDDGVLGEIFHYRAKYLQEWIIDPQFPLVWRLEEGVAGSGALGDLGAHIIDLGRYLVGEPKSVSAITKTFIPERPMADDPSKKGRVKVDDAFEAVIEFHNGAIGTVEASRFCYGRKNHKVFEINGSKGSIAFNLERLNELQVYLLGDQPKTVLGFHDALITEAHHPYWSQWWPHGHVIGWEHTFIHQIYHFLEAIQNKRPVGPTGATFEDGYKCAVICDAIAESSRSGKRVEIEY
ncbi:MAG: Gfo/Idh/MocA family oxidoreductase [candidate division Zixibacteria bacterium]|nr:Gfo/Idh/MocA family oxidoreductase [candidate division Zixibacteria bacterium]